MHRPYARPLVASLLAASLLVVSAGAVAADAPGTYVLDVFYCTLTDLDGNPIDPAIVPAGSEIVLTEGWLAKTRGQVQGFVNNVIWVLTVNGQSVDVTPYLSGVMPFGPYWGDGFVISAGTLGSGAELHTHYDNVIKSASYDGFFHWAKGSVYGGGIDCTVTAAL